MKSTALTVLLCLALLLTAACAPKGILIPLENDLPDGTYTREYLTMLNQTKRYRFSVAPDFGPGKPVADWEDEDYTAVARALEERGAVIVSFGRVVQADGYIGLLKPGATRKTDARFELVELIARSYYGPNRSMRWIIDEYLRDGTRR
jgi:hypothetical protein